MEKKDKNLLLEVFKSLQSKDYDRLNKTAAKINKECPYFVGAAVSLLVSLDQQGKLPENIEEGIEDVINHDIQYIEDEIEKYIDLYQ